MPWASAKRPELSLQLELALFPCPSAAPATRLTDQAGAPVWVRNSHGELPSDMCLDGATHSAFASFQDYLLSGPGTSAATWNLS